MSADAFDRLRATVLDDESLQDRLWPITDADAFAATVVEIATGLDLDVTEADVQSAVVAGDRRWIERWL